MAIFQKNILEETQKNSHKVFDMELVKRFRVGILEELKKSPQGAPEGTSVNITTKSWEITKSTHFLKEFEREFYLRSRDSNETPKVCSVQLLEELFKKFVEVLPYNLLE